MSATQQQIEKLKTLQESYDVLTDAVENQLPALADKIDNIDLSSVAKQGENQEATNSKILEGIGNITTGLIEALESRYSFPVLYDGVVSEKPIDSILSSIINRSEITSIVDDKVDTINVKWTTLGINNCKKLKLINVKSLNAHQFFNGCYMEIIELDNYKSSEDFQTFRDCSNLQRLYIPQYPIRNDDALFMGCPNLIDIEVGGSWEGDSYTLRGANKQYAWEPTNALSSTGTGLIKDREDEDGSLIQSNLDQLLFNIRRHIAANLRETTSGWTIYFGDNIKAAILADSRTTAAFTDKGWTIA